MRWVIYLGVILALLSPKVARTATNVEPRPTSEVWAFQPDDYAVILVESPEQPPNHLLQAQVSVWAAQRPLGTDAKLDFEAISAGVPAFRWSTATFHANAANPQPIPPERPTPYPPPSGFYGENGHLPPGIYFLSYVREQMHRQGTIATMVHRIGLADEPCRRNGECSDTICVPASTGGDCDASAVKRSAIQFHSLFHDPSASLTSPAVPASSNISKGCLTTTPAFLAQIFPPSMTSPETSPLQWNGTRKGRVEDRARGLLFHGSGNALIFVVDSLSPHAPDQALSLRHWLQWKQLTREHFEGGRALAALRKEWTRVAQTRVVSFDELKSQYARALNQELQSILGTTDMVLPRVLGYPAGHDPATLLAVDHPQVMRQAAASLRSFEANAHFRLAQGLAATDWSSELIVAKVAASPSSAVGFYDPQDFADMALILRATGDSVPLDDLAHAIQAVGDLGSKVRAARSRLVADVNHEALATNEKDIVASLAQLKASVETFTDKSQIDHNAKKAIEQVEEWTDGFEKVRRATLAVESLLTGESSEGAVLEIIQLAPREVREPAAKVVAVYRGAQAIQAIGAKGELLTSDIAAISAGVDAVAGACGINENDRKTLNTVLNVGMSLATGNYVGAAMSLLGTGGQPDPNAAAFAEVNAKLDALLEGQRKILKSLEEVKEAVRALEARVIAQHWEVLSRLSALEDEVRLNRRIGIELLEGNLPHCEHFGQLVIEGASVSRLRGNRLQWEKCTETLINLKPSSARISELHRFRTATADTTVPQLGAGETEATAGRPLSTDFLASVAHPMFEALSRLDDQRLEDMMANAAMPAHHGEFDGSRPGIIAPHFLESPGRALSIDGLLAPDRVLTYSRLAMGQSRFWLAGDHVAVFGKDTSGGFPEMAKDEVAEARKFLDPVILLLNQAIAQQVLLSGHALFGGELAAEDAALLVTVRELPLLLKGSALFPETQQNLARHLLASAAARTDLNLENVFAKLFADPNWLFTDDCRKLKSVKFVTSDSPPEKVALRFEKVSKTSYRLIVTRDSNPSGSPLGSIEVSPPLMREAHERAGITSAVELMVAARREAVSLLALTHLERDARVSLLGQAGRESNYPLEETR